MPSDQRKRLSKPNTITVRVSDLESVLDQMSPDKYASRRYPFTKKQDELLLKHRARGLGWRQLSQAFGLHEQTLHRRWLELTK